VQQYRKNCVHRFSVENDLFPEATMADDTISTIRQAIIQIYNHVNKSIPYWVNDDTEQGYANKGGFRLFTNAYTVPPGLDEHAPDTIKITYIYKDSENIREVLPAGTDPNQYVDRLIATIGLPISGIKVYRGKEIIQEIQFPMDKIRGT
jgi:hypothetical protein